MRLKRSAMWTLILGFVILLVGIMVPIIAVRLYTSQHGSIGIIGGADGPTAIFLTWKKLNGWPVNFGLLGLNLIVSAAFCLLFSKTVIACCSRKTTLIALGLSGFGALGIMCVFSWYTIVVFHEMSKHPIEYPASILLGLACLAAFIFLVIYYFKTRKRNWSTKGFLIDIFTGILYFPVFLGFFVCLYQVMG